MAKKPRSEEPEQDWEEYAKALEEELDSVWDMLKRLVGAAEKPDHALFDQAMDDVREWIADTS